MTIAEIKAQMTDAFISDETIRERYNIQDGDTFDNKFSVASIENIMFYCVALCVWALQSVFTLHKAEVTDIVDNLKPHTVRWYMNKALAFQYGYDLPSDSDKYDNTGLTDEQIAESKIIAYAAVLEQEKRLITKVAKNIDGDLGPLSLQELTAFNEYISQIKDAGVQIETISRDADHLSLILTVYYNPLVLNSDGQTLGSNDKPVETTIRNFLLNMPFNGWFVPTYLTDVLQTIDGVIIPVINYSGYKYGDMTDFNDVEDMYQPFAGYMRIASENLQITYIPQSPI